MVTSAIGTDNITVSSSALNDGSYESLLGIEIGCEGDDAVEFREIYHGH